MIRSRHSTIVASMPAACVLNEFLPALPSLRLKRADLPRVRAILLKAPCSSVAVQVVMALVLGLTDRARHYHVSDEVGMLVLDGCRIKSDRMEDRGQLPARLLPTRHEAGQHL